MVFLIASVSIPQPAGFVTDTVGIFGSRLYEIESECRRIEATTGVEIAVLVVETTYPESIEDYAVNVFEKWGIGKKEENNGVLILIAFKDRKIRIEVGYGLEEVLTDGFCGYLIRNVMAPRFRAGQFAQGVIECIQHIEKKIEYWKQGKEYTPKTKFYGKHGRKALFSFLFFMFVLATVVTGNFLFALIPTGLFLIAALVLAPFLPTEILLLIGLAFYILFFPLFFGLRWIFGFPFGPGPFWWQGGGFGGFGSGGGFGGFGGGISGGGGATGGW